MSDYDEKPRVGQTIWTPTLGNGIIRYIDYDNDRRVYCDFYEHGLESFEYEDLLGNFDSRSGKYGQWILPEGY